VPDQIEVRENRVWYSFGQAPQLAKLGERFLSDFLQIADAPPDDLPKAVEQYATRYGVLELCEAHLLPRSHPNYVDARYPSARGAEYYGYCLPRQDAERFCEHLSSWRYWSRQALAVVNLAGNIKRGQLIPREDFRFLLATLPREAQELQNGLENPKPTSTQKARLIARIGARLADGFPKDPGDQWKIVAQVLNFWLTLARPQPICTIEKSRPTIILAPGLECGWLFAMLAMQLMVAVTGAKALECCSNCRSLYLPKKLASTGTRRFCPKCGIRAARRLAQVDFRKRQKG
jgi:hypothetical protein